MPNVIDREIVELNFDQSDFERNVKSTMDTLDKLKEKIKFEDSGKSLDSFQEAVNKVSFDKLHSAVESLSNFVEKRFSILGETVHRQVGHFIDNTINKFEGFTKQFTVQPISEGLNEYNLKMGSVQTIMASTGKSLEEVNGYLDQLNTYADKTIYSFSDMTSNIGKFTNAGVELGDAVAAIQGVSNVAALSGANTQEASRAMYNFAQALSAGYVKLIDWKSIENANMATVGFKDELIKTALEMKTLVEVDGQYQSTTKDLNGNVSALFDSTHNFNEALSSQWMTTDVLTKTLARYANEMDPLGQKAFAAATEVKTFGQLIDTTKEAIGSGWAKTFELIIGDFNQAKELFTSINDVVSKFIDNISDARNNLLQAALGPIALSDGMISSGDSADIAASKLEEYQKIADEVQHGDWGNGDVRMKKLAEAGYDYDAVMMLVNHDMKGWEVDMEKFNELVGDATVATDELTAANSKTGRELLIESLANIAKSAAKIFKTLGEAWQQVFAPVTAEGLRNAIQKFHDFTEQLKLAAPTTYKLRTVFIAVFAVIRHVLDAFGAIVKVTLPMAIGGIKLIGGFLLDLLYPVGRVITIMGDAFHESQLLYKIFNGLKMIGYSLFFNLKKGVQNFLEVLGVTIPKMSSITNPIIKITNAIANFIKESFTMAPVVNFFRKGFSFIPTILSAVAEKLKSAIEWVTGFFSSFSSPVAASFENKVSLFKKVGEGFIWVFDKLKKAVTSVRDGIHKLFSTLASKEAEETGEKTEQAFNAAQKISSFGDKVSAKLDKIRSAIGRFFESIKNSKALNSFTSAVSGLVNTLRTKVSGWYSSLEGEGPLQKFSGLFTKYVTPKLELAGKKFGEFGTAAKGAFATMNDRFVKPSISRIQEWYQSLEGANAFEKFKNVFNESVVGTFKNGFEKAKENVKNFYGSLDGATFAEKIKNLPNALKDFYKSLDAKSVFDRFKGFFTEYIIDPLSNVDIFGSIKEKYNAFKEALSDVHPFQSFKETFNTHVIEPIKNSKFVDSVIRGFEIIQTILGKIKDAISVIDFSKFTETFGEAKGIIASISDELTGGKGLIDVLSTIVTTVFSVKTAKAIMATLGHLGTLFDTIGGAVSGIGSVFSAIIGTVTEFKTVFDTVKETLDQVRKTTEAQEKEMKANALLKTVGAIALLAAVVVALSFIPINKMIEGLIKMVAVLTTLLVFSFLFNKINKNQNSLTDVGQGILAISGAMIILSAATAIFAKMNIKTILKGFACIAALLIMFGIFIKKTSEVDQSDASWEAILAYAQAVNMLASGVKKFGKMNIKTMLKGLLAVVVIMIAISYTAGKMSEAEGGGKDVLLLAVALGVIYDAVKDLGSLDFMTLAKGLLGFKIILDSFEGLLKQNTDIKKAVALLLTIGGSLLIITVFIKLLADLPIEKSLGVAIGFAAVIAAVAAALRLTNGLGIGGMAASAVGIGVAMLILAGVIVIIIAIMSVIAYYVQTNLSEDKKNTIIAGLEWIKEVATLAGEALGSLLGGVIGGILEGTTHSLPDVATNLTNFMNNIQGFIDGAKGVDDQAKQGINTLMGMLKDIAVAEVWNSIADLIGSWAGEGHKDLITKCSEGLVDFGTSLLIFDSLLSELDISRVDNGITFMERIGTMASHLESTDFSIARVIVGGRESLTDFGEELVIFADALIGFSARLYLVSAANLKKAAECAQPLADLANSLPETSLLGKIFTGRKLTWSEFAEGMPSLAEGLSQASAALSAEGVVLDKDAFQAAADCATPLATLLNSLPNAGGKWQKWFGEKKWSTLTSGLPDMADALATFAEKTKDLTYNEGCQSAVSLSKDLSELLRGLPKSGGYWQDWFGEKKWSTLSTGLPDLGDALTKFRDNVATIEYDGGNTIQDGTSSAVALARDLTALANELPATGGVLQSVLGSQDLGLFAENLTAFSTALNTFCTDSAKTNFADGQLSLDFVQSIIDIANQIYGTDEKGSTFDLVQSFVTGMGQVALDAKDAFLKGLKPDEEVIDTAMKDILDACILGLYGGDGTYEGGTRLDRFWEAGSDAITKFDGGINSKTEDVGARIQEDVIDKSLYTIYGASGEDYNGPTISKFRKAGQQIITKLNGGINSKSEDVYKRVKGDIVDVMIDTLSTSRERAYVQGKWAAYGFCSGIAEKQQQAYNAGWNLGIAAMQGTADAQRSRSPSKEFAKLGGYAGEGYAIGMVDQYNNVAGASEGLGLTALDVMQSIVERVNSLLNGTDEFNPVITPVLDLTKVNEGVGILGGLFGNAHLAIPGTSILGDSVNARLDIKEQVRQGVLEALQQNPIGNGDTNNFYIDGSGNNADDIADAVIDKLNIRYNQRRAVFG